MNWEESLRNLSSLVKENQNRYRHDITTIPVSSIAEQYYCEQKVELEYVKGEVPTEAKAEGEALHGEILAMKKIMLEDLITNIKERELNVVSFPVAGRVTGLVVVGQPDAIVFIESLPKYVIELKTTAGDPEKLWPVQQVQVRIYGLLLDLMGFDCSNLKLVLVRYKRKDEFSGQKRKAIMKGILYGLIENKIKPVEEFFNNNLRIHLFNYSKTDALEHIEQAKNYWLNQRKPMPTKSPAKCKACEYISECSFSLAKDF